MVNMKQIDLNEKYPGINLIIPKSKDMSMDSTVETIQFKLQGW